jgi:CDP-4-dehydro-6-deoxyglucose reductase
MTDTAPAAPKGRAIYQMRVTRIEDHTPSIRELTIETLEPSGFRFQAGQFVMLHVPTDGKPALRAYSIASDDRNPRGFQLLFKSVENGLASRFVWDLKGGEVLNFTGPFGRVFFKEPPTEQIIFLNTGSGVSQHLSFLLSKAEKYPDLRYRMLFGVRNENEIYYQKQLDELTRKIPDFKYAFILSRPGESWAGRRGYVQNFIDEFEHLKIESTFYLCGNGAMIKDVKKQLIEGQGFDPKRILVEAFD